MDSLDGMERVVFVREQLLFFQPTYMNFASTPIEGACRWCAGQYGRSFNIQTKPIW